jgi:hypothetical protein
VLALLGSAEVKRVYDICDHYIDDLDKGGVAEKPEVRGTIVIDARKNP